MSARDSVRTSIAQQAAEWFVANREGTPDAIQRSTFAASSIYIDKRLSAAGRTVTIGWP